MEKFEKLSDYKRALKAFVRGTIKAKVFVDAEGKFPVTCSKVADAKTVKVVVCNGVYHAVFEAEVAARIFNKFNAELFVPVEKQFNKLKGFGGMVVAFED